MNQIRGAEALIEISDGKVVKERMPKDYRHDELDKKIRKERTEKEKSILDKARKYDVNVPKTQVETDSRLKMDKIDGQKLKSCLENDISILKRFGEQIAVLHSIGVIHGDLTTSNALKTENSEIYLIDFGLSYHSDRIEDRAVDIHLFKQVINSSHPENSERGWEMFLEGYKNYEDSEAVMEQLEEVEKRGRYK